jgi:phosphoserine phosphatase RsbU/P
MSNLQAVVKALASENTFAKELVEKVNRVMCRNTTEAKFITLFHGLLDADGKTLRYVNAGLNAPTVTRKDGAQVRLEKGGLIQGIFREHSYEEGEIELRPDRLVMFTDGFSEAVDAEGVEFGEARMGRAILRRAAIVGGGAPPSAARTRHGVLRRRIRRPCHPLGCGGFRERR